MNAIMRIVEYPKDGREVEELSTFSIDEFNVDYKHKTVQYKPWTSDGVLVTIRADYIWVDHTKSPVVITAGNKEV